MGKGILKPAGTRLSIVAEGGTDEFTWQVVDEIGEAVIAPVLITSEVTDEPVLGTANQLVGDVNIAGDLGVVTTTAITTAGNVTIAIPGHDSVTVAVAVS